MITKDTIGVAFLGVGRMGETHLRNLAAISGIRVIAVADLVQERAERGRVMTGAELAMTDSLKAIERPSVDAVVIVTTTDTHALLIEQAVNAGKAVWSEKPIALNLAETQRVVGLVRDRKSLVQVGFMRRFDPGYAKAKAKIDAGELGKLETFRALSRDTYPPSLEYLLGSGGLFLDMSVHDLDLARFLVGEVEQVSAWASVLIDDKFAQANDADTAVTLLQFKNGVLGVIETSRLSNWGYDIRTEVAGSVGKVVVEAPQKTPLLFAKDFASSFDHYENFPDRFEVGYRLELEAFFSALREGRTPTPGPEDALESLRLALALQYL
jgi:myo-inositol 2-dehydrogenase/D-chiro-inositol 1-dehydrogenase